MVCFVGGDQFDIGVVGGEHGFGKFVAGGWVFYIMKR